MEEQLNLQGHEINADVLYQQPVTYEDKTFRKSNAVIVFWVIMFIFVGLVLLVGITEDSFGQDEGSIFAIWFLIILEIIFMFKVIGAYLTTITVGEDSLIYRKGVLFRHKTETPYLQIISVESSSFLGMGSIEVILLNNNSFKYKHVQKYEEAESLINERVKQSRLKVQVAQSTGY